MPGTGISEERLQRLIDEDDIRQVMYRYTDYVDSRKWEEFADLFTEDGTFVAPFTEASGHDALVEFANNALSPFGFTHHNVLQSRIEIDGDTAHVWQSGIAWHIPSKDDLGTNFAMGGYYDINMVRTADGWKIKRHEENVRWTMGDDTEGLA